MPNVFRNSLEKLPGTQIDRAGQFEKAQVVPEMRMDVIGHRPKLGTGNPRSTASGPHFLTE